MEGLPGWVISPIPGPPPRQTIHTKHTLSHPNKANMEWWWRRPNDIRGPWGPNVSWHLSYRWWKTPKKTSPRKPVPTGDRTRARCVTSAHATSCSTAVDILEIQRLNYYPCVDRRAVCGHTLGTADDKFRSTLCSVHWKTLSQTALHSRNNNLHLQPLQRCYCENAGSPTSACFMWHHYCMAYRQSLHAINATLTSGRVGTYFVAIHRINGLFRT